MGKEKIGLVTAVTQLATAIILLIQAHGKKHKNCGVTLTALFIALWRW